MEGRRRAAQFATLAPMCSPALTFVADGDGREGGKGRRLCGLAISQDGREKERRKTKASGCQYAAVTWPPSLSLPPVAHPAPLPSRSLFLSQSFIAQKRGALATWRQFPYSPKSQLLYAHTSSCTLVPIMKRTSYDLCWSSLSLSLSLSLRYPSLSLHLNRI